MNCEQIKGLLSAYLDNQLTEQTNRAVTQHLEECTYCNTIFSDYQRYDTLLAQLPYVEPPPHIRDRLFPQSSSTQREATSTEIAAPPTRLDGATYMQYAYTSTDPHGKNGGQWTFRRKTSSIKHGRHVLSPRDAAPIILLIVPLLTYLFNLRRIRTRKPGHNA